MSTVSTRWRARRSSDASTPTDPARSTCLADLRPGMRAEVVDIDTAVGPSTARRLFDLGFTPGSEVTVLRRAPLGDPVVLHVAEYEVALRRAQTTGIRVQRTA